MSSSALSGRNDSENLSTSEIYEHSPSSLLPLLQFHLPASTLVYGSILCASSSAPSDNIKVWSNIPSRIDGLPIPIETDGTVLVQLSSLSGGQLRIFDTLDSHSNDELDGEQLEEGKNRVIRILKEYMGMYSGSAWKVGGLHERWVMAVIDQLADGVDPEREGIWLPPRDWGTQTSADDSAVEGYEVDIGREVDIQAFSDGSAIPRDSAYYRSRLPWSTVIRPTTSSVSATSHSSSQAPVIPPISVCRILTSADGSLGTLSTDETHRRKGLSQWVIREHLTSGKGWAKGESTALPNGLISKEEGGHTGYSGQTCAVVFDQNIASQEMFRKMGWERKWGVAWVRIYR